ncbi:hypothetical protein GGR60_000573 [Xanthomonas arboricola]|nr:hypothetical protein [Xanthomonas euroxanthea]
MHCKHPRRSAIAARKYEGDRTWRRCGRIVAQVHVLIGPYVMFVAG